MAAEELPQDLLAGRHGDMAAARDALLSRHALDPDDVPGIAEAADCIFAALSIEPLLSDEGYIRQVRLMDAYLALPLTDKARAEFVRFLDENPKEAHGGHSHRIEDLGFTRGRIAEIFEDYIAEFGAHF